MLERPSSLAVVDGVTDSLGLYGYKTVDNDEISTWMRALPKQVAKRTGAVVILVDHVAKDPDSRGRFAIGGQAKLAGLTGAAYTIEVAETLGRGLRGITVMRIGKDRHGYVRGESGPMRKTDRTQETARVVIDSTVNPDRPSVTVEPWSDRTSSASPAFRPTTLMEHISDALMIEPSPLSFRSIGERVKGKQEYIRDALGVLVAEGFVTRTDGPRGSHLHALARSYKQHTDPLSDGYRGQGYGQPSPASVTVSRTYNGYGDTDTQPSPGHSGTQSGHGQTEDLSDGIEDVGGTCSTCYPFACTCNGKALP
jgi:hypothetical protein